jgi:acyl carrier protein phosphodiesterase
MNYLAHLYLAEDNPESLVGNLLGDFVKGAKKDDYPEAIRQGIELHRKVDRFTDAHAIVRSSLKLISPSRRRFAGVIVDIFYDHLLAKNWAIYSPKPLANFSHNIYQILKDHHQLLPERLQTMLPYIIHEDWLTSYGEIATIDRALNRISRRFAKRFGRDNALGNAVEELQANYQQLESDFHSFFPDLINYVKSETAMLTEQGNERVSMNGEGIPNETLGR